MEKDKRVLLIGGKGFMVNSVKTELASHELEVIHIEPNVKEIEKIHDKPNVYLLYIDDLEAILEVILYIKERIVEERVSVNVIGNHEDIESLSEIISKERFAGLFERPVNVKNMATHILEIIADEENRNAQKKILVVDDDGTMLRTMDTWLSEKYQVFMVNSGMAAITFLAKKEVDLILLDYEMPVTPGPQVLEMLRTEPKTEHIPVMFLTNKSDKESVMHALNLKPEKYLLKTLPKADLLANIDEFFEKQKVKEYMD